MLNKTLLFLAVTVGMTISVSAQDIRPTDDGGSTPPPSTVVLKSCTLSLGPKVGGNYTMAKDPEGMSIGMKGNIGYNAGLAFNLRFARPAGRPFGTERLGFQLEASYTSRSLKTDYDNIKMNCWEVPVLFQWYFVPNFAVEIGPTFTGVLSASPDILACQTEGYHIDELKSLDVMLSMGINCKLKKGFTFDIRYNLGNSALAGNFDTKVSTISVGIGWLFTVIK